MHTLQHHRSVFALVVLSAACASEVTNFADQESPADVPDDLVDEVGVVCGGSTTDALPVSLLWLHEEDELSHDGVALLLTNNTQKLLDVVLKARLIGANGELELADQNLALRPGISITAQVDPEAFASVTAHEVTPLAMLVRAEVDGATAWAELRYLHREGRGFQWYSQARLGEHTRTAISRLSAEHGVQPSALEAELIDSMQVVFNGVGLPDPRNDADFDSESMTATSGSPATIDMHDHQQHVCFLLTTDFVKGGMDFTKQTYKPAHGARVWLSVPKFGTFFGYASKGGRHACVSFPSLPAGTPFYMGMYFETEVGKTAESRVLTRAFDKVGSPWSFAAWNGKAENVPRNAYYLISQGPKSLVHLSTHPGNWRMANLLAVATHQRFFYEKLLGTSNPTKSTINMRPEHCPGFAIKVNCLATPSNAAYVAPYDNGIRKAELIAHEVGHLVEETYSKGITTSLIYVINDTLPACDGYGEFHALNSKEWSIAGLKEGLASALGAYALSSVPTWRYYKSIAASEGLYDNQIINLEDAGTFDYMHNECSCEPDDCTSGFGVESDWMRFLWEYWQTAGVSMPTFFARLSAATPDMPYDQAFARMRAQIPAGAQRTYFDNRGKAHGIATSY